MIDQAKAEEIAKHNLFATCKPGCDPPAITKCVEHSFGWVIFYFVDPDLEGVSNSFIVERDGTVARHLGYGFVDFDLGIKAYEAFWKLKNEFASAQMMANEKKFNEAVQTIEKCLAKLNADPLLEGPSGSSINVTMTINYLNALGNVQRQAKDLEVSERTLLKAKKVLDDWSPVTEVASLTVRMPVLESLIALRREQKRSTEVERIKREMATAHRTQKEHGKAQEILEQLLQKRVENLSAKHPAVAQILTEMAALKGDLAQFYESELFLDRAMQIWEPLLENHDEMKKFATADFTMDEFKRAAAETMECYASFVLMRQGKREEASAIRQRAKELAAGDKVTPLRG